MTDSLKDQLLKLGFKSAPREAQPAARKSNPRPHSGANNKPNSDRKKSGAPRHANNPAVSSNARRNSEEMDLAKAYAIRAQKEKDERLAAEQQRQEEARLRREGRQKLNDFLSTARLNHESAEIARHFNYGGKIRRIHVTEDQLKALNAGELAVVQLGGRYHLVTADNGVEAEKILPGSLALQVDPNAPEGGDDYSDSQFQVPDDLVW